MSQLARIISEHSQTSPAIFIQFQKILCKKNMFTQNPDGSVAFARYATDGILSGGKITRGAKDVQVKTTGNLKFPTLPKLRLNPDETWPQKVLHDDRRRRNH